MYQYITFEDGTEGIVQMEGFGVILIGAAIALGATAVLATTELAIGAIKDATFVKKVKPILQNHSKDIMEILTHYDDFRKKLGNRDIVEDILNGLDKAKLGKFWKFNRHQSIDNVKLWTDSNFEKASIDILKTLCESIEKLSKNPKIDKENLRYSACNLGDIGGFQYETPSYSISKDIDAMKSAQKSMNRESSAIYDYCKKKLTVYKNSGFMIDMYSDGKDHSDNSIGKGSIFLYISFDPDYPKYKDLITSITSEMGEILKNKSNL